MLVIDFYCFTQRHTNLICKAESTLQFATYFFFNFDNRLEETSNGCRNRLKSRQHIKKLGFHVKIRHPKISMAWHHWRSKAGVSFGRVAWFFSLSLIAPRKWTFLQRGWWGRSARNYALIISNATPTLTRHGSINFICRMEGNGYVGSIRRFTHSGWRWAFTLSSVFLYNRHIWVRIETKISTHFSWCGRRHCGWRPYSLPGWG